MYKSKWVDYAPAFAVTSTKQIIEEAATPFITRFLPTQYIFPANLLLNVVSPFLTAPVLYSALKLKSYVHHTEGERNLLLDKPDVSVKEEFSNAFRVITVAMISTPELRLVAAEFIKNVSGFEQYLLTGASGVCGAAITSAFIIVGNLIAKTPEKNKPQLKNFLSRFSTTMAAIGFYRTAVPANTELDTLTILQNMAYDVAVCFGSQCLVAFISKVIHWLDARHDSETTLPVIENESRNNDNQCRLVLT